MISLDCARQLKQAGLRWRPAERDFFAIPDRQMDKHIFVVSELTALLQIYNGQPVVSFHGSTEWALDYVLITEVIWLPSEAQLRDAIAAAIGSEALLRLDRVASGYRCQIGYHDRRLDFEASQADEAYALALLYILQTPTTGAPAPERYA